MKLRLYAAVLCAGALLIAGCGGNDNEETTAAESEAPATIAEIEVETGPFETEEDFVAAVNGFCETAGEIYSRTPVYGVSAPGLEKEFTTLLELEEQDVAKTESIEAPEELADEWADYNKASAELTATHEDVLAAAKAGDVEKANQILGGESSTLIEELSAASEAVGVECVDLEKPLSDEEPAAATEVAAAAPQPSNTIEEIADEWLAAFQTGDCDTIIEVVHTQARVDAKAIADPATGDCQPRADAFAEAEIVRTVQWGPVGYAAVQMAPGQFAYEVFVIDPDQDNELRHVGEIAAGDNGLDAPNEGIDADETVAAFLEAVRADDPEAVNETLSVEAIPGQEGSFYQEGESVTTFGGDPEYSEQIITDIKADEAATPELIGANQLEAVYLLETESENDYLLVLGHEPGSVTEYRVRAFWALPGDTADADA